MQKILIDTDPGQDIDDLLAIHFALKRPELDVRAITTVTYPSAKRARLAKSLLRRMGRSDIPVAAGMDLPLRDLSAEELKFQKDFSRTMNHYAFAEPEDPADAPDSADAVELIIESVDKHPGEIALCCIAPLTNVACAFRRRPDIAGKIKFLAMMGGEPHLNRREHNVAFDYAAAAIVLGSGARIYMGTWDVTRRFFLTMEECRYFHSHRDPLVNSLGKAIDLWHPAQSWKPGPVMYDLFPIVHSFDKSFYTLEKRSVLVETKGDFTRGMTVFAGGSTDIEVTVGADAERIKKLYLETALG